MGISSYLASRVAKDGPLRQAIRAGRVRLRESLLFYRAGVARAKSAATVIAVTGSSGKSTTTSLLAHILQDNAPVEIMLQPQHTEEIAKSIAGIDHSTGFLVAEMSVGPVGHMRRSARTIRPDAAIVTYVGLEHFKTYRTRQRIAAEKSNVVAALAKNGFALLNADDELVMTMWDVTTARTVTFGRKNQADYRVVEAVAVFPDTLEIDVDWAGRRTRLKTSIVGEHFWLPVVAAFAAAIELGVTEETALRRIASYLPLVGKCQPYPTSADGPTFLLDTDKAPRETVGLAFEVVAKARVERKRIVLGMMSDFPGNPKAKYRDAYRSARSASDQVIFVGEHSHRSTASAEDRKSGRFHEFASVKEVARYLQRNAGKGELILIKGSRNMHLERIALAWNYDVKCWNDRCGLRVSCFKCGLFEFPFEQHERVKSAVRIGAARQAKSD